MLEAVDQQKEHRSGGPGQIPGSPVVKLERLTPEARSFPPLTETVP